MVSGRLTNGSVHRSRAINRMKIKRVSVIGLGKLGLPMATCFAAKGFPTIGVDKNSKLVESVQKFKAPFFEPQLQETLNKSRKTLVATTDMSRAIDESDATFLIVPTPSDKNGEFSSKYLEDALHELSLALRKSKKKYHLFVVDSTVMPGTTEEKLIPLIKKVSGRKLNKGFGICYNPEFIALGSVIHNLMNPDVILIGESSREDGDALEDLYRKTLDNDPQYSRMSIISAEIMKISLNVYVTMKISFANQLAQICSSIPGADLDAITKALGGDKRIGPKYLKGGISYGGPCFPRDNRAFSVFAGKLGHKALLSQMTDEINRHHVDHLVDLVLQHAKKSTPVLVLGAAYKGETHR
jgi:UDPglucose 6-dehydrogenase